MRSEQVVKGPRPNVIKLVESLRYKMHRERQAEHYFANHVKVRVRWTNTPTWVRLWPPHTHRTDLFCFADDNLLIHGHGPDRDYM